MIHLTPDRPQPEPPQVTPALRRLAEAGNLPTFLTPFIGRDSQVATVSTLLSSPEVRQVTLVGPGGVGKTRLALAIANEVADKFDDGVAFVDLSPVRDPLLVLPAIARAIGIREETGEQEPAERLRHILAGRQILLVLDNCEQVTAAAPDIGDLLVACPELKILATSRAVLRLSGEHLFAVPPLDLPELNNLPSLEELAHVEAVAIFIQRGKAADPHFGLTDDNASSVAAICGRLEGIPLAIELAAARVNLLSPPSLLARLERRLPLLTAGARDAPSRQRTLRETLAWSYDLLSSNEQSIFRSASIFAGGFTLDALEQTSAEPDAAFAGQELETFVLDSVMSLVEQSLVRPDVSQDNSSRFSMLETVREFGIERLAASSEIELVQKWQADWCLKLAESALPHYHGPHVLTVLEQLETESDNFRQALAWSIERNESQTALRLGYGLWRFWWMHGHLSEGRSWLEKTLATSGPASPDLRSKVLAATGYFARIQGDFKRARELGEQSIALARRHDDYHAMSGALDLLGLISFDQGDHERATAFHTEALALDRQQENAHRIAVHCYNLAVNSLATGDLDRAEAYFEETLSIWKSRDDAWGTARALIGLGRLANARGDSAAATELLFESIALSQSVGDKEQVANSLTELASLTVSGNAVKAATLFGAAEALRDAIGAPISPADRARYDGALASVRKRLPEPAFQAAWQAGVSLASEEAIVHAIRQFQPSTKPRSVVAGEPPEELAEFGITSRELEVYRLLIAGRSNNEIADELSISVLTVKSHVSHILAKLDLPTRAAAVAFFHRRGQV